MATKHIIAFSDSHNTPIPEALLNMIDESEFVFFLGDGTGSLGDLAFHSGFFGVSGNCDTVMLQREQVIEIEGVRILLTHGDRYSVKRDLSLLAYRAQELNCSVVFYGHTHFAEIDRLENITFVCPGSIYNPVVGEPTYATATITNGKFLAKIVNINQNR